MAESSYRQLARIEKSSGFRAKLSRVADDVAGRAEGIAAAEGVDAKIRRESGTRPRGRPYERVLADAEQEHGSSRTARKRVLGRAVQQQ